MDPLIEIHWTERASEDLEVIVRYIARRNPEAAGRIGRGFFIKVKILRQFPELGSILDELRDQGWRKLIYRRWKIIYTYRNGEIIIGRVWPTAMGEVDLDTSLETEDW